MVRLQRRRVRSPDPARPLLLELALSEGRRQLPALLLVEGRDWSDYEDLLTLIPALQGLRAIRPFHRPDPSFRIVEQVDTAHVEASLDTSSMSSSKRHLRLSTSVRVPIAEQGTYEGAAAEAGRIANDVFESIVPRAQLVQRFGTLPLEAQ